MDFEHLRATMASRSTLCSSLLAPIVQRPRTPAFHAGNTGSNPVGGARIASGACGASRKPAFSPSGENALASGELVKLPSSLRGAFRRHAGFNVWLAFGSLRRPAGGGRYWGQAQLFFVSGGAADLGLASLCLFVSFAFLGSSYSFVSLCCVLVVVLEHHCIEVG